MNSFFKRPLIIRGALAAAVLSAGCAAVSDRSEVEAPVQGAPGGGSSTKWSIDSAPLVPLDKNAYQACLDKELNQTTKATAQKLNVCLAERAAWREDCIKTASLSQTSDKASAECYEQAFDIEKTAKKRRPTEIWTVADQERLRRSSLGSNIGPAGDSNSAISDFYKGRPLPSLPDLSKPIYIAANSEICKSLAQLSNPDIATKIMIGMCTITASKVRVLVVQPKSQRAYVEQHMFRRVQVVQRSSSKSDATVYSGWVSIKDLSN